MIYLTNQIIYRHLVLEAMKLSTEIYDHMKISSITKAVKSKLTLFSFQRSHPCTKFKLFHIEVETFSK